jgi:thiol-disulfide isomerase/thioredoxin
MTLHRSTAIGISCLVLTIGFAGVAQDSPLVAAAKRAKQQRAAVWSLQLTPDIRTVRWFNSRHTDLRDFKGQVFLIDLWATWCSPCVSALPELQALAREFGPRGFTVVLIHSRLTRSGLGNDMDTPAENVLPRFIADHKIVVPVAIAEQNEIEKLGVRGFPHYLLIDRKGFVRYNRAGKYPEKAEIQKLLTE